MNLGEKLYTNIVKKCTKACWKMIQHLGRKLRWKIGLKTLKTLGGKLHCRDWSKLLFEILRIHTPKNMYGASLSPLYVIFGLLNWSFYSFMVGEMSDWVGTTVDMGSEHNGDG
jgi:hypothetical protein